MVSSHPSPRAGGVNRRVGLVAWTTAALAPFSASFRALVRVAGTSWRLLPPSRAGSPVER